MTKLLAIDDKHDNLTVLSALLKNLILGCEILTAESGAEGLEKAKNELPDTILLDIRMPGMDGYETCKRLKKNEVTKHIPVIMLSAIKTEPVDLVKGLDSGADAYLAKPIDEHVLAAQVKTVLRIKEAEGYLRDQKKLLEYMVQERTGELQQTNLELKNEVNKHRETEESLNESEVKYRSMMEAMNDPVYICSSDYRIKYMNPAMIKRTGRNAVGENCFKAVHDLTEQCPWCLDFFKTSSHEHTEHDNIVSPKDKRSFHVTQAPLFYKNGSFLKMTILRDTTDWKRMEEKLRQAQKMESIGTLAGGIAHDFNNILFPIIGYTEMTIDIVSKDSVAQKNLYEILKASMRAKELIQQILTFSRQHDQELKPLMTQLVVKEALKLLRSSLPATITIRQDIKKNCGYILADPTRIHQIVMNLCTNAFHAMEESGGTLKISLSETELSLDDLTDPGIMPGRYICLKVSDTGHGIDEEVLSRMFDPYFTTKERGKGTGLGLSVVHGIVKSMDGDIHVESEPGKGTVFHIYLPIIKETSIPDKTEINEILPVGNEHILLVDDEEMIIFMEKQMIENFGYHVTARTGSIEALEAFRAQPDKFDLVITDMTMPNMTGDRFAMEVMKIRPDIPVIICTGFSEKISKEKADVLGIKGLLLKPFIMKDLAKKIREVLHTNILL